MLCSLIPLSPSPAGVKELEGTGRDRIREASFTVDCEKHEHIYIRVIDMGFIP